MPEAARARAGSGVVKAERVPRDRTGHTRAFMRFSESYLWVLGKPPFFLRAPEWKLWANVWRRVPHEVSGALF